MKLTNEEKDILRILLLNDINYYENEEEDYKEFIKQLKDILKKLESE